MQLHVCTRRQAHCVSSKGGTEQKVRTCSDRLHDEIIPSQEHCLHVPYPSFIRTSRSKLEISIRWETLSWGGAEVSRVPISQSFRIYAGTTEHTLLAESPIVGMQQGTFLCHTCGTYVPGREIGRIVVLSSADEDGDGSSRYLCESRDYKLTAYFFGSRGSCTMSPSTLHPQ